MKNSLTIMNVKNFSILTFVILCGCNPSKNDNILKDFYLSQNKDYNLIGNYKLLEVDSFIVPYYAFESSGNLTISSDMNFDTMNVEPPSFWYSRNDTIFILRIGDYRNETYEYTQKYIFNNTFDTLKLEFVNNKNEIITKILARY